MKNQPLAEIPVAIDEENDGIARLWSWEPYVPSQTQGDPNDCYPAEGGVGYFDVLTPSGEVIEGDALPGEEWERCQEKFFELMEGYAP